VKRTDQPFRLVSALDPNAQEDLRALNDRMAAFYNALNADEYFEHAQRENAAWDGKKYHEYIRRAMKPGMHVLELGCGSGHAYENIRHLGVTYTGVDWSRRQIETNRRRLGDEPQFLDASLYAVPLPDAGYDLVFSMYVLEHLVWPHRFLDEAQRLVKPGGILILLCPEFRHEARIPSLQYTGRTASLRGKIRRGQLLDALLHAWRRQIAYPYSIRRNYPRDEFPFLINLQPSCLQGVYYPDNDAVYFVDREEVSNYISLKGMYLPIQNAFRNSTTYSGVLFLTFQKNVPP
jgi:ubiquinone/menaquinone biosynthesis C-methylase UbiE